MSHAKDEDQTGVDRQERICREVAERLGLVVSAGHVFVDNNRSAWQRNRRRKGWDALLELARRAGVSHILTYHPDRLMRQPRDLEELLAIADEHDITLHGEANQRDLSDPDDRYFLRIEVAHSCRSSDDTSRRLKSAVEDRARDGKPHGGRRQFGYSPDGMRVIGAEAEIVKWVFEWYLDGKTPREIARMVNARGIPTANGAVWSDASVRRLLDSHHVAGVRVFRGQDVGRGEWPAIIDRGMWEEVRERRAYRAAVWREEKATPAFHVLRGLVMCTRCGTRMNGAKGNYVCGRQSRLDELRCTRKVEGARLERFVVDAALDLLERLDMSGQKASTVLSDADRAAIEADRAELAELKDMWDAQELSTREYRAVRKTVEDRIKAIERKTVVRPAAGVLRGVVGSEARRSWKALEAAGDLARMNAILRFLFSAVKIAESKAPPGKFDWGRIDIEQNPL